MAREWGIGGVGHSGVSKTMTTEEPPGTEQNSCHCESSGPFMGRIKVNGKPYSSPLSKRNAGERQRKRAEAWNAAGFC